MIKVKEYLSKRPMLVSAIICTLISVLGYYCQKSIIILASAVILLLGLTVLRGCNTSFIIAQVLTFAMVVSLISVSEKAQALKSYDKTNDECDFIICDITYKSEKFCCADVEVVDSSELEKGTRISVYYNANLEIGDKINSKLRLSALEDSDYKSSYYSRGIYLTANMYEYTLLEKESDFVLKSVNSVRKYIKNTLFENLGYREASTLCALVFGDDSYFTSEFYGHVKAAGVSHVMVVSGMHLTIIVSFFSLIFERLFYNRYFKALLQITVVILLSALCGFTMSILRAGVTYILGAAALVLKRRSTPENTLGAAVTFILIGSPYAIFSIAFQLSVLSTFGILSVAIPILNYIRDNQIIKNKAIYSVVSATLITLSALILTLPVIINIFGYVSTVAVFSNLLISFAVTLSLGLAITGLIFNLVLPFAAQIIFLFCGAIVKYINAVIDFFGSLWFAVLRLPRYFALVALAGLIILFWILIACKKRNDMLKLKEMRNKILSERRRRLRWQ